MCICGPGTVENALGNCLPCTAGNTFNTCRLLSVTLLSMRGHVIFLLVGNEYPFFEAFKMYVVIGASMLIIFV